MWIVLWFSVVSPSVCPYDTLKHSTEAGGWNETQFGSDTRVVGLSSTVLDRGTRNPQENKICGSEQHVLKICIASFSQIIMPKSAAMPPSA